MVQKTLSLAKEHIKSNKYIYLSLFLMYIIGISAGSIAVNQLDYQQKNEMTNFFNGFLKLLDSSSVEGISLFKLSFIDHIKVILLFWILGFLVIGFPVFYCVIAMRGFTTGFSSGVIIGVLGVKGMAISTLCFLPKEIIVVPCLIALAVNGIKLSGGIFKNWFKPNARKEKVIKQRLMPYSIVALFYSFFIILAIVLEAFLSPGALKMISTL